MASLREVIQTTHHALESLGIPDARLEAEVMVMSLMGMSRRDIYANQEAEFGPQQEQELDRMMERRVAREPLAYILGYREFYGINLLVTPNVLIPRPETETMVEYALFMALAGMETAIHLPAAQIYALDCADPVLDVAAYNIRSHNVADRIKLGKGDLLEPLPEPVDLIAANLPYIPTGRIATLQPEVQWEPREALDGGADGLDVIRRLMSQAPSKMKDGGAILLELDPEQVPMVQELARQHFPEATTSVEQDLARRDRVIVISHQS